MLYIHCLGDLSKNKQDGSSLQSQHSAQNLAAKHNRNFDKYSVCYYNNEKNLHRNSGTVFLQREIWIKLWSEQSFNLNISPLIAAFYNWASWSPLQEGHQHSL